MDVRKHPANGHWLVHNRPMSKPEAQGIAKPLEDSPITLPGDNKACYRAIQSNDARFDGRLYVGVQTTGIYCRPVCKARLPKPDNCQFFSTAPAAEQAGFRPCLRCRPENAPGWSTTDISTELARSAAKLIESGVHRGDRIVDIANRLGVSDRHLRRLFEASFGVTPIAYLQTHRLLLAKRLLTDTNLSVTHIAQAVGFNSSRRLNACMRDQYDTTPTALRKSRQNTGDISGTTQLTGKPANELLRFKLAVRTPYDFDWMLAFFSSRALDGLELVDSHSYSRVLSVSINDRVVTGFFSLSKPQQPPPAGKGKMSDQTTQFLVLEVSPQLTPAIAEVFATVRNLFDLDAVPEHYLDSLGSLATNLPGLRLPGCASGFELAVRAVLGQQITVKAARTLAQRFVTRFGEPFEGDDSRGLAASKLTHAFPSCHKISRVQKSSIAKLGIIGRRAETIRLIARQVDSGELDLSTTANVSQSVEQLNALPGIGDWTAQYIAMRALRWPDAFPAADYGVMKSLQVSTPAQARKQAEQWRPWRAYAVMHLWASLNDQSANSDTGTDNKTATPKPKQQRSRGISK